MQTFQPTQVDQILVAHQAYQLAERRITNQLIAAQQYAEPTCIALVGESRTGKSRLAESILYKFPKQRTPDGMKVPVLSVKTPSKPTVKGLVETLLSALEDPACYQRASENEKTERLYTLIRQTGTHTIIIDEFQHFYDQGSHKVQHYLSDWLKIFVDNTGLTLVVVGLPSCMAVINQNEQLRGRFMSAIPLRRFDWQNEQGRGEFMACLDAFAKGLPRYEFPDLNSEMMAFRFYCATGGLIGYVAKVLHQACLNANIDGTTEISLDDLAQAFEEAVWTDSIFDTVNPFKVDIDDHQAGLLLNQANHIGSVLPELSKPNGRGKRKLPAASEVLVH